MMFQIFSLPLGTVFQGGTMVALIMLVAGGITVFIKGIPERLRAQTEREAQDTKAASDIRDEYALRYKETRIEVHALRGELMIVRGELATSQAKSVRRGDKLNMVLFILQMVMDELHAKEPSNKILTQARTLLGRVENEPIAEPVATDKEAKK